MDAISFRFPGRLMLLGSMAAGQSGIIRPFCVIFFLRYTTNVLLGYCPDGHPATLLPFLSGSCGPGRHRCNP